PEQVEGKKLIDQRSDIYSFGVTCYHLFAGRPPFQGTTAFEVAMQHVQKKPRPLGELRPDLPAGLCAIIHKMMAKERADRYERARDIVRAIARIDDEAGRESQAPTVPARKLAPQPAPPTTETDATVAFPCWQPSPWPRRLLFASLLVVLAAGVLI